jgi:hypothetical protein
MRTKIVLGIGVLMALAAVAAVASPADGYRLEKRFDFAPGGRLVLRTEGGAAEVRGGDTAQAIVLVTSKRADFEKYFAVRFEESAGRLEVKIERRARGPLSWFDGWNGGARVVVDLPRSASAEVSSSGGGVEVTNLAGEVEAKSSGGGVAVSDVGGDVRASSSGGGVAVERIGGSAVISSSGGGVQADAVAGDVEAGTSGGGVKITEAGGRVVASSSGGAVRVGFAAGNSKGGDLHSSGGGVHAWLDPAAALDIDAHSSGGGVACDLPVTVRGKLRRNELEGKLNGGGAVLELSSSGGGVSIEGR